MINYFYDCYTILNKVYSEKTYIKQAINGTFIEEKNRALTIKTVYGVLDKDIELSYMLNSLVEKNPKLVIRTILKISMYAIKYLEKKPYAVTKNAVELTKKLGKGGASGFVNAFLRKFINAKIEYPLDTAENLSVRFSYPLFAVKELLKKYDKNRVESIISAQNTDSCLSFYQVDGEKYLNLNGYEYQKTPFENVFFVKNFVRNEDFDNGVYTFQSIGSVAICDVVDCGNKLLDCCSAPGGKSIRLSHKFNEVESWDIHEHRVELINAYAKRMNINNIKTKVVDSKVYLEEYKDSFDVVLCDAPCSGLGVVSDNPDIKLNREENSIKELNDEQLSILKNVSKYVKVGGCLYYSTCSILERENKAIIDKFMSDINGFEICKIDSKLQHENVFGANLFLPDISSGAGFFVAKLKRVK